MTLTTEENLRINLERTNLLRRITNSIRRTLELQEILNTMVEEMRLFLGTERVMIYKFHLDGSGQVIAESINNNRLPSLKGLNFPADDIPLQARELFINSRVRCIVDVESQQIGQSPQQELETGEVILEDIHYRPVDPCHIEYLTAMGVKSSLVAPIIHNNTLWGLLTSHHSETRLIAEHEVEIVQMVVDQLAVAIAQFTLLTQAREKAAREVIINRISSLLHSLPVIILEPAVEEAIAAFGGCGGRLCIKNEAFNLKDDTVKSLTACLETSLEAVKVYTCGQQPIMPQLGKYQLMEQYSVWQEHEQNHDCNVWAISDIYQTQELRNLQVAFRPTKIRSILMIPIEYRQQLLGYLSIFREEIDTETLWAGQLDGDERQLYPRLSFEIWRESKKAQARQWTVEEIELAGEIGKQFATAIHDYQIYQKLQGFNSKLENQVQERTIKLQQATEQQRILFEVVAKMRKSLDINTIFSITTKELRHVLNADRVAIYRFDPDSEFNDGEFITEDVLPDFTSTLAVKVHDYCFGEIYATKYRFGQIHVVVDIYNGKLTDCHIKMLAQFQIKAQIIMPLMKGDRLWGLLCIHQCTQPREWQNLEIQFATQVAAQLSVALEQADLLVQTKQQAEQLAQALQNLQQTQTKLIQTEKMSSLGQLVAGVAHEINNPVNFIYGNISHVHEYTNDLLTLLEIYQQQYPNPCVEISQHAEKIDLEFIVEDLPKMLSSMKLGSDRIRQIVLSLRNFSRIDQSEMKAVDIRDGIDSTLLILQHRLKVTSNAPEIQIIKEYGDLPLVECYAGQLNQVFMNVLSNAIDALEHESESASKPNISKITINTSIGELEGNIPSAIIRIGDNGTGIPESLKTQIFDPFFTTKPIGKGTGLGLSISSQIVVEKHGGVFKCDSQPGLGTEFWIEIPIAQKI
jgi:light-regulated signal transduction histidine kinase (bacteriophytochrome)